MCQINRRVFLQAASAGLAGGAALGPLSGHAAQPTTHINTPGKRPNVVLIITDDQGYGDLGCHGNPVLKTPHIDRLHGESVRFTQFNVSPVCSPTRACLMTGRYNYRTGVVDTYAGRSMMDPCEKTLAEMLRAAGYRTGIFGKWHLGDNYPLRPMDRGFDTSLVHFGGGIAQPSDPEFYERDNTYFDAVLQQNGKPVKTSGYCTDVITDAALQFIAEKQSAPFFAYVSYNAPHTPLQVPDTAAAPYRAAGLDEKTAQVYGMIANMDHNVGRIVSALEEKGLAQDTVLIFMTDNGAQDLGVKDRFNAGLRNWKGSVYDGGIRVPFFMRWPAGFSGNCEVDRIAAHIDIAPTLLALCGAEGHDAFDGMNLMPLILGGDAAQDWPERTLFFQWHRGNAPEAFKNSAVRTQRWKLVNGEELYDMAADPGETTDLAATVPETVRQLRAAYEAWFADVSASRGYAPVRIHLGSSHENPLTLSRQDWRNAENWMANKPAGFWEVHVERAGDYTVRATFAPAETQGTLCLKLGGAEREEPVASGATEAFITGLRPQPGNTRLECWLAQGKDAIGARFVTVTRTS